MRVAELLTIQQEFEDRFQQRSLAIVLRDEWTKL